MKSLAEINKISNKIHSSFRKGTILIQHNPKMDKFDSRADSIIKPPCFYRRRKSCVSSRPLELRPSKSLDSVLC